MSVNQNSGNVNSLFNQAIGRSTEPEIDPDIKEYIDDAIDDAIETITAAYTAAISTALNTALAAIPVTIEEPTETTVELEPCPVTYDFGEVASLTLTVTSDTHYHFSFKSPAAAATVVTITGITGYAGDEPEADAYYEVDIWHGLAVYQKIDATEVVNNASSSQTEP